MTAVLLGHVGNFEIQPDPYGLLVPLSRASGALCSHAGLEASIEVALLGIAVHV